MYQTEKNNRGAFGASFFNTVVNVVQTILKYAGKDIPIEGRSIPEFDLGSDSDNENEAKERQWAPKPCPALQMLKMEAAKSNSSERRRVMTELGQVGVFWQSSILLRNRIVIAYIESMKLQFQSWLKNSIIFVEH